LEAPSESVSVSYLELSKVQGHSSDMKHELTGSAPLGHFPYFYSNSLPNILFHQVML